ncbi:MAG: DoxX family protein [Endomicrobiales bacterium]
MLKMIIATGEDLWLTMPLRISVGIIFFAHGAQKLLGWFGGHGLQATAVVFADKLGMSPGILWAGLAAGGEFFGGVLILLGLFTRFGALMIVVTMLVAMFKVHWGSFFLPAGIEYTLALLGSSLSLLIAGGGKFSLDEMIRKRLSE